MTRKTLALIACCMLSPAVVAAQTGGLTHVQVLALQQQLKEECGLAHATGRMDGPTRHAIAVCNKKYGTQGNGAALLAAMNIGFNSGDNAPQGGMGTVMGNDNSGMSMGTSTGTRWATTRGWECREPPEREEFRTRATTSSLRPEPDLVRGCVLSTVTPPHIRWIRLREAWTWMQPQTIARLPQRGRTLETEPATTARPTRSERA
jgi:hypothetical protein